MARKVLCWMGGRNGGADCTAWETLLVMKIFDFRAGETDQGAITLVLVYAQGI